MSRANDTLFLAGSKKGLLKVRPIALIFEFTLTTSRGRHLDIFNFSQSFGFLYNL